MEKNKILLYEKMIDKSSEVCNTEDGKTYFIRGNKIFKVVKPIFDANEELIAYEELAQYDSKEDFIDLNPIKDYVGWQMVSVDFDNKYHKFEWNTVTIGEFTDDARVFMITDNRKCTPEECSLLNSIFPEYFDNAFFINADGEYIKASDC